MPFLMPNQQRQSTEGTSPSHYLLFVTHAKAACSAVIPMLCHVYQVSLSVPYLGICLLNLAILISARWSATTFSLLIGQVSLPCNMLLRTQLLYNLPLIINNTFLLVSSGTNCLKLFQPIQILASTAASASPSTLRHIPKTQYKTPKN